MGKSLWLLGAIAFAACSDASPTVDARVPDARTPDAGPCGAAKPPAPPPEPALYTPRWAFEPWISKDISTGKDTYAFVDGFKSRDIPVGAVVIDSPWETHYNTFVPHPTRYPAFKKLVADMHGRGVKVVMWITQMINRSSFDLEPGGDTYTGASPNFALAEQCKFLVNEAKPSLWWKGSGAGLDFFNPRAVAWWHTQQDKMLDLGIDGWKLDFGEEYIIGNTLFTAAGNVTKQKYSEAYYQDFLAYGVSKRGRELTTMVRGYDRSYNFKGRFFARPEHAPVVWMGDNRRDWVGLADALDHLFRSARAGYAVVGSDIGGYLDLDDEDVSKSTKIPFDQEVFARWTAHGALTPFMQLHGRANITPWTVPTKATETVALYRYWSWLHRELVPFFYSLAQGFYLSGDKAKHVVRPIGEPKSWPGDYRYQLGEALLVAPILRAGGKRDVALPAGARWYDWFRPGDAPHAGGTTLTAYDTVEQRRIPVFVREGAIIPLEVTRDVTKLGSLASKGHLTLLVYPSSTEAKTFSLHETDDKVTTITTRVAAKTTTITLSRLLRPTIFRVRAEVAPVSIKSGSNAALTDLKTKAAFEAAPTGWYYDAATKSAWAKVRQTASTSLTVTAR